MIKRRNWVVLDELDSGGVGYLLETSELVSGSRALDGHCDHGRRSLVLIIECGSWRLIRITTGCRRSNHANNYRQMDSSGTSEEVLPRSDSSIATQFKVSLGKEDGAQEGFDLASGLSQIEKSTFERIYRQPDGNLPP